MDCLGLEPGAADGRCRRIHWAMAAPLFWTKVTQTFFIEKLQHKYTIHEMRWKLDVKKGTILKRFISFDNLLDPSYQNITNSRS